MGTLKEEIEFFHSLPAKVKENVTKRLYAEAVILKEKIASESPVHTGRYARSWRMNKGIASVSIFNPLSYATALEEGIDPGANPNHPWVVSYRNKKNSGGLVKSKGVIWSAQNPGGTVNTVFTPAYTKTLAQSLADAVIEVF